MMRTLNARLSAALLALLLLLGTGTLALTLWSSRAYVREVQQKLHRDLAGHVVQEHPLLRDPAARQDALDAVFEELMVINPDLEFYLLDAGGGVLAYAAPPGRVLQDTVALAPLHAFLRDNARLPILGTDPRNPTSDNIFSAAEIHRDGQLAGYLYIVLASEQLGTVAQMLGGSYILRVGGWMVLGSVIVASAGGLLLFRRLTRRLRHLTREMSDFESRMLRSHDAAPVAALPEARTGQHVSEPEPVDEIDRLERSFRHMERQIGRQVGELEQQDQKRRDFLANISHDIRTPLTHLQGYLETLLMRGESLSGDERRDYLQIAAQRSEQLGRLVADLFDLAKFDTLTEPVDKEPFAIAELVQDVAQEFRLAAGERNIVLDRQLPDTQLIVHGNLSLIERVLQNLIDNAIRYARSGDRVSVTVGSRGDAVRVTVSDTGPGIPPDRLPHIFDRFYHRTPHSTPAGEGSGLGLAIAKRALELHDSELVCRSEVGVGTTFHFELASNGADTA